MSTQRWHEWRNFDITTCPSHGVVRIDSPPQSILPGGQVPGGGIVDGVITNSDNEVFGANIILTGIKPLYTNDEGYSYSLSERPRGFSPQFAINGDIPVEPGGVGLCTYDLPTWVAVKGHLAISLQGEVFYVPDEPVGDFGAIVTVFDDWYAITADADALKVNTGCIHTLASNRQAKLNFIGGGVVYQMNEHDVAYGIRATANE